ncbi:MAG: hypothetical protein HOV81_07840 [Kofleriaceae bacterium]|nr:hypothetical protein [Kofleriaceae bacterium]
MRLFAIGCVVSAAVGCGTSEAGPGSGLTPPASWKALPQLATAATQAAKEDGVTIDISEAWADQARGCYAAWLAWRGAKGAPEKLADALVLAVSSEKSLEGIAVRDVVKPTPGGNVGVVSLGFERGEYRGTVRAQLTREGQVAALACFWNQREPAACAADCGKLVGSMK